MTAQVLAYGMGALCWGLAMYCLGRVHGFRQGLKLGRRP